MRQDEVSLHAQAAVERGYCDALGKEAERTVKAFCTVQDAVDSALFEHLKLAKPLMTGK